MRTMLDTSKAAGGGDSPEDVAGALFAVTQLQWMSEYRAVIHIADAPPHGLKYHDPSMADCYLRGDHPSRNLDLEMILRQMAQMHIDYTFVRAGREKERRETDKYVAEARRIFEDEAGKMRGIQGRVPVFRDRFLASDVPDQFLQIVLNPTHLRPPTHDGM